MGNYGPGQPRPRGERDWEADYREISAAYDERAGENAGLRVAVRHLIEWGPADSDAVKDAIEAMPEEERETLRRIAGTRNQAAPKVATTTGGTQ